MKRAIRVLGLLIGVGLLVVVTAVPAPRGVDWGRVVQTAEQRAELGQTAQQVAAQPPPPRHWGGVDGGAEMGAANGVTVGLPRTVDSLGLPLYPPSSLPTRFYDNTEYDVAPLSMPLDLPNPAPPPAFIQQSARAYPTPAPAPAMAPAPRLLQPFAAPIRFAAQRRAAATQPIAPMLFEQSAMATVNTNANDQADEGAGESQDEADEGAEEDSNESDESADDENEAEGEDESESDSEDNESDEEDSEGGDEEEDGEESSLLEARSGARSRMSAAASSQLAATAFLENEQAMRSQSRSRIGLAQQTYLYGQALAPGPLPTREGLPNFAENPQSVAARGPVPHFSALVRELPRGQPVAPYAGFFEARSRLTANNAYGVVPASSGLGLGLGMVPPQSANYGRPLEPVLESLPPPPIVLAV